MYDASAALAMTSTADVLIPVSISGIARGISILNSIILLLIPIPLLLSKINSSTFLNPRYVFIKVGGTARITSANKAGKKPVPSIGITSTSTARLGIILKKLNKFIMGMENTLFLEHIIPSGTAIPVLTRTAKILINTCILTA